MSSPRLAWLDALRGAAIVWMMGFHLCFDLQQFRLIPAQDFYEDPFWTWQRTAIVSLFLLCAGAGQAVAQWQGQAPGRFWRRWGQVVACALLVSAGSAWMFPRSWISFGVLHGIAVMLLVVRALLRPGALRSRWLPAALVAAGALAVVMPMLVQHPWFDSRWTNWVGLVTHKPVTEDYVPLLPWLGVMLWGVAGMLVWLRRQPLAGPGAPSAAAAALSREMPAAWRPLVWLGRRPLTVYMLHQPIFIGTLTLLQAA